MRRFTRWARSVNWWLVTGAVLAVAALTAVAVLAAWAALPVVLAVLSLAFVILAIR
jgi:hypothetical protein